jgi:hypothetical protein
MAYKPTFFGWALLLLPALCFATNFGGDWGTTLYLYRDRIDTLQSLTNFYENLNIHAININGSDISVFANANATNAFSDPSRKEIEINHFYLDWRNIENKIDLRIGRQRNFEGVEPVYFDGLSLHAHLTPNITLSAYGGPKVPSRFSSTAIETNKDSALVDIGARAQAAFGKTFMGLSFHQDQQYHTTTDRDVGVDLSQSVGKLLFCRGDYTYSTLENKPDNYELFVQLKPLEKLKVTGTFYGDNSKPDTMDIFATRIFKDYYQASFAAAFGLSPQTMVSAGYVQRIINDDNTNYEIKARFENPRFFAEFLQDWGYGGFNTQGNVSIHFWKTTYTYLEAGGTFMRYGFSDTASAAPLYAWLGRAAVDVAPMLSWWNSRLELQFIRNRFYQYDTRLLFVTHINFSTFTTR